MPNESLPLPVPREMKSVITEHVALPAEGYFRIRMEAPSIAAEVHPGQFVQVRINSALEPFLRRPFSIGDADPERGWIEVVYHVVGSGSQKLSEKPVGSALSLLGPLGNGFRLPEEGTALLVGGGVGMPPVFFAAKRTRGCRVEVIQGARTAAQLLFGAALADLGIPHSHTTEDGSAGTRGLVTAALSQAVARARQELPPHRTEILACGPPAMIAAVALMAKANSLPCQVSVEERMACGFGICMGCAVEKVPDPGSAKQYALVCVDGPVFDASSIVLAQR